MVSSAAMTGILLVELIACMLRSAEYRLLARRDQDADLGLTPSGDLLIEGRGASHQVDALGDFGRVPSI